MLNLIYDVCTTRNDENYIQLRIPLWLTAAVGQLISQNDEWFVALYRLGRNRIQPDRTKIKVSTSEAFTMPDRQEPVLTLFRHLEAEEIVGIEETAN